MKKLVIFLLSVILTLTCVNLAAQNPFCTLKGSPILDNSMNPTLKERQKSYRSPHLEGEGCSFRLRLQDPAGGGWLDVGIQITVDGVEYGIVTLPWLGGGYEEVIRILPSGKVQFTWIGEFYYPRHCFEIYNSLDSLIFKSDKNLPNEVFLIYQNECIACVPITDFEGVYVSEEHQVNLSWEALESDGLIGFDIYRNDMLIDQLPPATVSYSENTAELEDGDYKYCVIPVYPSICSLDEKCFETYISNVGITKYKDHIMVYPNPAKDFINITGDRVAELRIYNNIGQLILTQYNKNEINISGLTNGLYILTIETITGHTTQKKLIINH